MDKPRYFKIYNEIFTAYRKLTCENMSSGARRITVLYHPHVLMFRTRYIFLENNSESGELWEA